jgi:nitrate reductase NapAB chaperone NapD
MALASIHIKQTLPEAVASYRTHLHSWPGLSVEEGEGKIIVRMEKKLSIFIRNEWRGWPVEQIIQNP